MHDVNTNVLKQWHYSALTLGVYLLTFVTWKLFPSRLTFLFVGLVAVTGLTVGLVGAHRSGYFANRLDLMLHVWVIVDLILETAAFETFKAVQPLAVLHKFHNNFNFIGCAAIFSALVGGHRWLALRKNSGPSGE